MRPLLDSLICWAFWRSGAPGDWSNRSSLRWQRCSASIFFPSAGRDVHYRRPAELDCFIRLSRHRLGRQPSFRSGKEAGRRCQETAEETEQLYALSRAILLTDPSQSVGSQAARHIAEIFECQGIALYDAKTGELFRGGATTCSTSKANSNRSPYRETILRSRRCSLRHSAWRQAYRQSRAKGPFLSDGALQALLNLVAIALERVRMEEAANGPTPRVRVKSSNRRFSTPSRTNLRRL